MSVGRVTNNNQRKTMDEKLIDRMRDAEMYARHLDWSTGKTINYMMDRFMVSHETVIQYFKERGTL